VSVPADIKETVRKLYAPYTYLVDGPQEDDVEALLVAERQRSKRLAKAAKALVDAVAFDDVGMNVGTKFVGGNGGLLSRETIAKADELRRAISALKEVE
jgi:hypothetical protein